MRSRVDRYTGANVSKFLAASMHRTVQEELLERSCLFINLQDNSQDWYLHQHRCKNPKTAHTHPFFFTDTNRAWFPSSHNLYGSLTELRLPFESILAIIVGPQNANSNCIQLQGLVIIYTHTKLNSSDSIPRFYGNVTERPLDTELHYSTICLKLKVN